MFWFEVCYGLAECDTSNGIIFAIQDLQATSRPKETAEFK